MSDDLVKRLRSGISSSDRLIVIGGKVHDPICLESADRIEALEAERDKLRATIQKIADMKPHHAGQTFNEYHMQQAARAAIAETEGRGDE